MWAEVTNTPASRVVDALEMYRKADQVVRDCVAASLLGCDTPESYDRLERAAIRQGSGSFDAQRLEVVGRNVEAIVWTLRQGGVHVEQASRRDARPN